MRTFGLLLVLALFVACASQKDVAQNKKGRCAIKDSTQYELIVFDSGFDFWLASHQTVSTQHSNEYYQSMNHQYALEWNRRYASGDPRINSYIDYNLNKNYGFDFNYKLYMYFRFFEDTNRVKLIPGNRSL
ncbi:DUF6146 family protein [Odoribacter sp. AF15-53]|uniref:DUF6146 family protein n=1 Tax=Odoribacter sp. AF15-53 TaxID=2292236 RepID=UPI000E4A0A24|nr:DUF6146 family protein [Odoribacter sp. AF15-53]RHR76005.1 hypothetical protein DWW52_16625 [Odoribacter sp. AF15-53]